MGRLPTTPGTPAAGVEGLPLAVPTLPLPTLPAPTLPALARGFRTSSSSCSFKFVLPWIAVQKRI